MKLVSYLILLCASVSATAIEISSYENVPDEKVLLEISHSAQAALLPEQFSLLDWNLQKGEGKEQFVADLATLGKNQNLVLTQEAMFDEKMPSLIRSFSNMDSWMAQSWAYSDTHFTSGVMTLSTARPKSIFFRRSPGTEPLANTPKMTLGEIFSLANGQSLLVLNIHAINFVANSEFRRQIEDIATVIQQFTGKILFAGDFNTWNSGRLEFLDQTLTALGLTRVLVQNDPRTNVFDHIYLRGCTANKISIHSEINSSDHFPIEAEINCQK